MQSGQEKFYPHIMEKTEREVEAISSSDVELVLAGIIAFWGDGKISKKEMVLLEQVWDAEKNNLNLLEYTDFRDEKLCRQEYMIALFEFLEEEELKISKETDVELPEKFKKWNKKKLKNKELTNRQKVFVLLVNDLGDLYDLEYEEFKRKKKSGEEVDKLEDRRSRMKGLYNFLTTLSKADGNQSIEEKEMISLMKHESSTSKWIWVFWIAIIYLLIAFFMRD